MNKQILSREVSTLYLTFNISLSKLEYHLILHHYLVKIDSTMSMASNNIENMLIR